MLVKTKHLRCLFTIEVVQLVIWFKLTESKTCKWSGDPGVQKKEKDNIVAISCRGAISGKDDEYIVEFCQKQARYYLS